MRVIKKKKGYRRKKGKGVKPHRQSYHKKRMKASFFKKKTDFIPLSDMPRHPGYDPYGERKRVDLDKIGKGTISLALATPMTNAVLIPAGLAMIKKGEAHIALTDEHDKPTTIGRIIRK